ncbi:hypothetical protein GH714_022246 [Hevea brasiliensis]|uniref:Uncharacterized protein n=1 Tax=Hevea brasiliensis TaxID=3981 RepID=A0A6A6KWT3_HEVBR|nr:hypothetical protein GH714_022246 [Hevea brasiliensis]
METHPWRKSTLFRLIDLETLNLAYNDFNCSQIPSQVGQLSRLTHLNLSYSWFSGEIPPQVFNLSRLISLDLSDDFGHLKLHKPSLRDLVQNFIYLKELHLSRVNISSRVPDILANFSALESLRLSGCELQGEFPIGIFQLPNLKMLDISGNEDLKVYMPPFRLGSILKSLILRRTYFVGELPSSIGNLACLEEDPDVLQWAHLTILDIRSNMLQGSLLSIPLWSTNYSDGSISLAWRNGCNLRFINLSQNRLQGQVPRSLANCSMLEFIDFGDNQLNDSFPCWLGNLPKLRVLILRSNGFYGALRKVGTGTFPKLHIIDLSQNEFTGDLPSAYFEIWDAMKITDTSHMTYMGDYTVGQFPYFLYGIYGYSITMNNKGLELEYLKIPSTLAAIDLSCPVPQGKQFDTFDSNSYQGNSGLCGALLEKKCGSFETIPSTPSTFTEDENSRSFFKINWMIILIGYAGGLIVGVVAGNEFTKRKHDWFVKAFRRKLQEGKGRKA